MAAKKTASKTTSKTSKSATGQTMPYGVAIYDAIKTGDTASMKRLLSSSKKYHSDLGKAIDKLEGSLKK